MEKIFSFNKIYLSNQNLENQVHSLKRSLIKQWHVSGQPAAMQPDQQPTVDIAAESNQPTKSSKKSSTTNLGHPPATNHKP
jgi:hypothetical protein